MRERGAWLKGRELVNRYLGIFLPVVLAFASCTFFRTDSPSRSVKLDKSAAEKVIKDIEKDRAETKEWLRSSPTSYLVAVNRVDFNDRKTLTIGRAADNDLRLEAVDIESHHLRASVDGDYFRIECVDSNARFKIKEEVKRDATVGPSYIQTGRFVLRFSHQRFPAVIVFDPQSPRMKEKGISYFPIDLSYRYELPLKRYPKQENIAIGSTRGNQRRVELVGWVDFLAEDVPCRLDVTRLDEPGTPKDAVQIFFRDASSGMETYQVGRYVDLKKLDNGKYLLDFNLAYNPACAYSNYYNCPIPPKSNNLKIAIRAGEMDPHYHHSQKYERNLCRWTMWLFHGMPSAYSGFPVFKALL
jgi:uncharacterized protein